MVTSLSEEVFFARLHLQQNDHEIDVDSRPSDAIALAMRFECPIFVAETPYWPTNSAADYCSTVVQASSPSAP